MGKNQTIKQLEKKYTKLKTKHKMLKQVTKASIRLLQEVEREFKADTKRKRGEPLNLRNEIVQSAINEADPKALTLHITIPPSELWLSELLEASSKKCGEGVLEIFVKEVGKQGVEAGQIISAKAEGDPKDGKWIVTYLPKKENINSTVHHEKVSIPISS